MIRKKVYCGGKVNFFITKLALYYTINGFL